MELSSYDSQLTMNEAITTSEVDKSRFPDAARIRSRLPNMAGDPPLLSARNLMTSLSYPANSHLQWHLSAEVLAMPADEYLQACHRRQHQQQQHQLCQHLLDLPCGRKRLRSSSDSSLIENTSQNRSITADDKSEWSHTAVSAAAAVAEARESIAKVNSFRRTNSLSEYFANDVTDKALLKTMPMHLTEFASRQHSYHHCNEVIPSEPLDLTKNVKLPAQEEKRDCSRLRSHSFSQFSHHESATCWPFQQFAFNQKLSSVFDIDDQMQQPQRQKYRLFRDIDEAAADVMPKKIGQALSSSETAESEQESTNGSKFISNRKLKVKKYLQMKYQLSMISDDKKGVNKQGRYYSESEADMFDKPTSSKIFSVSNPPRSVSTMPVHHNNAKQSRDICGSGTLIARRTWINDVRLSSSSTSEGEGDICNIDMSPGYHSSPVFSASKPPSSYFNVSSNNVKTQPVQQASDSSFSMRKHSTVKKKHDSIPRTKTITPLREKLVPSVELSTSEKTKELLRYKLQLKKKKQNTHKSDSTSEDDIIDLTEEQQPVVATCYCCTETSLNQHHNQQSLCNSAINHSVSFNKPFTLSLSPLSESQLQQQAKLLSPSKCLPRSNLCSKQLSASTRPSTPASVSCQSVCCYSSASKADNASLYPWPFLARAAYDLPFCPPQLHSVQFKEELLKQQQNFWNREKMKSDSMQNFPQWPEEPVRCPNCTRCFHSQRHLTAHLLSETAHPIPQNSASASMKNSNTTRWSQQHHHRNLSSLKTHKCQVCGRAFSRSDMLARHMRLHTGVRPYSCIVCGLVFSRSDHLNTHMRTHTGEKPYKCPHCPYAAPRRDQISRHIRIHIQHAHERRLRKERLAAVTTASNFFPSWFMQEMYPSDSIQQFASESNVDDNGQENQAPSIHLGDEIIVSPITFKQEPPESPVVEVAYDDHPDAIRHDHVTSKSKSHMKKLFTVDQCRVTGNTLNNNDEDCQKTGIKPIECDTDDHVISSSSHCSHHHCTTSPALSTNDIVTYPKSYPSVASAMSCTSLMPSCAEGEDGLPSPGSFSRRSSNRSLSSSGSGVDESRVQDHIGRPANDPVKICAEEERISCEMEIFFEKCRVVGDKGGNTEGET